MKNVVVYTSNTCGYCHSAKKFLDSMSVKYTEKNVSDDAEARKELIKMGFMGVPVIMVDKEKLKELLG